MKTLTDAIKLLEQYCDEEAKTPQQKDDLEEIIDILKKLDK
jgi:hypothetical protein